MKRKFGILVLMAMVGLSFSMDTRQMQRLFSNHIEQGRSFLVGIAPRRQADSENILVRFTERIEGENHRVDVMELYVNNYVSFFVVNRSWIRQGSSTQSSFDGIGLQHYIRKRNARNHAQQFLRNIDFHRQSAR